jgi:hypothetical protein
MLKFRFKCVSESLTCLIQGLNSARCTAVDVPVRLNSASVLAIYEDAA